MALLFPAGGEAAAAVFTPFKILIVPGHDNHSFGARYGNMKEADMNLALGDLLYGILDKDFRFEPHIVRDREGFTDEFEKYFRDETGNINSFIEDAKKTTEARIESGEFKVKTAVPHKSASEDVSLRLYGINKWANENEVDAILHVHFNDHVRKSRWVVGKYSGFAVYAPDKQFPNAVSSLELAKNIFTELHDKYSTSTYPDEKGGLIQDQKLIALGSNGTLAADTNAVLVEYGYIYEKKFRTLSSRQTSYKDMAARTARGITSFFFGE